MFNVFSRTLGYGKEVIIKTFATEKEAQDFCNSKNEIAIGDYAFGYTVYWYEKAES